MKKLIFKISTALLITLFAGMELSAIPKLKIVGDTNKKSMIIHFQKHSGLTTQIRILDSRGVEVWEDEINGGNVSAIKYNLKQLPAGNYELYVGNELSLMIQPLEITGKELKWDESKQKEVFKPFIKLQGKTLDYNQLTLGYKVHMKLLDGQSNVLYFESFNDVNQIEKRFDLKKLDKGNYHFVTQTQGEQFVKAFTLN